MFALTLLLPSLLTGCGLDDLPQESDLDRLRVLGFQATPAEPRPGDTVTFDWLTWTPAGEAGLAWEACMNPFDCPSEALRADARELLTGGDFDGSQPLQIPPTLLDTLSEEEKQEGIAMTLGVVAVALDDAEEPDEWGTKALPVSEADTPNDNPVIAAIEADGQLYSEGDTLTVYPGQGLDLTAVPADGSEEVYQYINSDGETEERTEEHNVDWYSDLGSFSGVGLGGGGTDGDAEDGDWVAPDEAGEGVFIAVARDGRGGTGWLTLRLVIE